MSLFLPQERKLLGGADKNWTIKEEIMVDEKLKKRALFETFVDKVVAYKDGKIVVNVDVFGTKAKIESIDGVVNGVRTEKLGSARSTKGSEGPFFHANPRYFRQ